MFIFVEQKIKMSLSLKQNKMEKMLFNSKSGNLFEVLVSGGGMGNRSFTVQLWSNLKKKWINTHINHTVTYETPLEEVLEVFKEKVENSTFA